MDRSRTTSRCNLDGRPTRRERRALDRQIDRLVRRLEGMPVPNDLDLDRDVGLLHEGGFTVASRANVRATIGHLGFAPMLDAIDEEPPGAHAGRLAVLVWVREWLSVQFVQIRPMARGGTA